MAGIEMIGSAMLTARLLAIPSKLRQSIEKKALTEGNKLVLGTLRQHVPIATGALKQSLTQDIRTYKGGNTLIGRVGAGKDYVKMHKGKRRRPSKYLHIVDRGFDIKGDYGKIIGSSLKFKVTGEPKSGYDEVGKVAMSLYTGGGGTQTASADVFKGLLDNIA